MKIKSLLAKPYAAIIDRRINKEMLSAVQDQQAILKSLIKDGARTAFGRDHHLAEVTDHTSYTQATPIRDYEGFRPWIEKIKEGGQNILWRGRPIYFAKTSGTTSGTKYIPITKDSISNHIDTARNALLRYMAQSGTTQFADGKMIFLSGSPTLERVGDIPTGRLSGIVNHYVPRYLRTNQLPSFETNCIEDWEEKLGRIVTETVDQDMRLISGIPPWMQMYFDWLLEKSGKDYIRDLFPHLQVLVHGGVNFEPYRARLMESIGGKIDTLETFPASEGFFAFQDLVEEGQGLLLNTNSGIFFEFVPVAEMDRENPTRLSLEQVELGKQYALIITSNAGLWSYNIGDTVRFVSLNPYRIVVTGRTKHYISAFGEHVIAEEVEAAMLEACARHGAQVREFTVAPMVSPPEGLPYHEWLVAFDNLPPDTAAFGATLNESMRRQNAYYDDLISGNILRPLMLRPLPPDAFIQYMKKQGKLGGQNKVPRLSNDRKIAEGLLE